MRPLDSLIDSNAVVSWTSEDVTGGGGKGLPARQDFRYADMDMARSTDAVPG